MRVSKLLNDAQVRPEQALWSVFCGWSCRAVLTGITGGREVVGSGSCHVAAAGFATQST